jgi:hypothetical protein
LRRLAAANSRVDGERGELMDKDHSRLIIILLTGILFVMLVGREVAISFMGNAFWIALAVGTLVLIVLAIVALIRFTRLEVRLDGSKNLAKFEHF